MLTKLLCKQEDR